MIDSLYLLRLNSFLLQLRYANKFLRVQTGRNISNHNVFHADKFQAQVHWYFIVNSDLFTTNYLSGLLVSVLTFVYGSPVIDFKVSFTE